ncbi:hypothetical protein DES53_107215 [Roseimicrobium gellanilyticum]|uniref:Polysaccharide deacetylase n=1 Tax=Roseimicrobium gellanilyticum TaxID=748857 RepID=A0A366HFN6_9BACT|nr:hypothetical protein [Roseimicrobium gellanilyticum]RBP41383.1 hypothetical protein DES53_107215 [Roseimicrobium gellanilyticum]
MKFPFISKSRHHAEVERLKSSLAKAKEEKKRVEEKVTRLRTKLDAESRRAAELEALCEARLTVIESSHSSVTAQADPALIQLCEARLREMERLQSHLSEMRRSRIELLDRLSLTRAAASPYTGPAIPTILGVDVEPDARVVEPSDASWQSTSEFFRRTSAFRSLLSAVAGGAPVHFTWFPRADPQVEKSNGSATWAFEQFKEEWNSMLSEGDEIGLHVHPWRWDEQANEWFQDHVDEAWVTSCVRSAIEAYRRALDKTPASYRGGDRYLSNAVVRILEQEGVQVDVTLERMPEVARLVEAERGTGVIPDGTSIPSRAYRPSAKDFRIADPENSTGLGILPLTSYEKGSLSPWLPNVLFEEELDRLLSQSSAADAEGPTHLAFVIRSNLVALPTWEDFVENALSLARRAREGRLVFATASEAWSIASSSL